MRQLVRVGLIGSLGVCCACSHGPPAPFSHQVTLQSLGVAEPTEIEVAPGTHLYFRGGAHEVLKIRVLSGGEPVVTVFGPRGRRVSAESRSGERKFLLAVGGLYVLTVEALSGKSAESFRLAISSSKVEPSEHTREAPVPLGRPPRKRLGTRPKMVVAGRVGRDSKFEFSFTGDAGETVKIGIAPEPSLAPVLELRPLEGKALAPRKRVPLAETASFIHSYKLPRDGMYIISVDSYRGGSDGYFILAMTRSR